MRDLLWPDLHVVLHGFSKMDKKMGEIVERMIFTKGMLHWDQKSLQTRIVELNVSMVQAEHLKTSTRKRTEQRSRSILAYKRDSR